MIQRVQFNRRIDGPLMSFEDAVIRDYLKDYPNSFPVDELIELPHGVSVLYAGVRFTVPWGSIAFTQGPELQGPAESWMWAKVRPPPDVLRFMEQDPNYRPPIEATQDMVGWAGTAPASDVVDGKPCPVCGVRNKRSRFSFLCSEHATPENLERFKRRPNED